MYFCDILLFYNINGGYIGNFLSILISFLFSFHALNELWIFRKRFVSVEVIFVSNCANLISDFHAFDQK